jgi:hypothetical protein
MLIADMTDEQFIRWRERYERKQRKQERKNNYRGIFPPGYVNFLNRTSNRTNMTTFELIRRRQLGNAINGQIRLRRWVGDGVQFASLENTDYVIPAGTYEVRLTYSPRFKKQLPLLMNVPGRTGIRIHTGSKPEHSQGCILVGATGKKMIEELITLNNTYNEKTFVKITEAYGSQAEGTWQQSFGKVAPYHPQLALPAGFTDGIDPERALPE